MLLAALVPGLTAQDARVGTITVGQNGLPRLEFSKVPSPFPCQVVYSRSVSELRGRVAETQTIYGTALERSKLFWVRGAPVIFYPLLLVISNR